jgi:hypothetical protein
MLSEKKYIFCEEENGKGYEKIKKEKLKKGDAYCRR